MIKAFTLIELMVVVSIITIISSVGIIGFFSFIDKQEIKSELFIVEDSLSDLDNSISNKENLDYEVYFDVGSLGFYSYNNIFGLNKTQSINMNWSTLTGTISTSVLTSELYSFTINGNDKFIESKNINSDVPINYNFSDYKNYKISGNIGSDNLNDINIYYYSVNNLEDNNKSLELVGIYDKDDKTGTNYTKIIIQNINGNKKFYKNTINPGNIINSNELYLFFEMNGVEEFIKITK